MQIINGLRCRIIICYEFRDCILLRLAGLYKEYILCMGPEFI